MRFREALLGLALLATAPALAQPTSGPQRPLRLVMNNELQTLDPIVSFSVVTRTFGYFVWDTLVSADSRGELRPQMLEGWRISDDRLTWTFTLREGLEWHDGQPVTAEDCVASLRRWGAQDGLGRQLIAATKALRVVDARTFVLELARPFGQVLQALGKAAPYAPFMMPARIAATPPGTQITEIVGSGPFTFNRAEWRPGDRAIFHRNARYRPRAEPADGLAGGKVVTIEQAEIVSIPDPSTRVSALRQGEVDYLERVPLDFVAPLQRDRNVVVTRGQGLSQIMGTLVINHAQPPFDNPLMRQALQQAIDQSEVMAGLGLPPGLALEQCLSVYMCDSPLASDAGAAPMRQRSIERARSLLQQAGYRGERIVILHATDSVLINPVAQVTIGQLQRIGLNLDIVATDWSTIAQRWVRRGPIDQGGWNLVPVVYTGFDMQNPLVNPVVSYNCAESFPGWYCDPARAAMLAEYAAESDPAKQREIAARMQASVHENVSGVLLGQFAGPAGYRSSLRGVLEVGFPVLWNITRGG